MAECVSSVFQDTDLPKLTFVLRWAPWQVSTQKQPFGDDCRLNATFV